MGRLLYVGKYLERENYRLNGTRIQRYLKIVNGFLKNPELTDEDAWALIELEELYVILKIAERHNIISRKEISICVKGAHYLDDELANNSGNAPRNYSFQLYIAAKMLAFNMDASIPSHASEADVWFLCDGIKIPVECKRLYAAGEIEQIVKNACSQVSKRVARKAMG